MAEATTSKTKSTTRMKHKATKSHDKGKNTPPVQEHSFLTDRTDVKLMEQELLSLMDDFHQGRLHAFGSDFTIDKMDKVRDLQDRVAQMHFEMDSNNAVNDQEGDDSDEAKSDRNLEKLMKNLENLSSTIQSLHKGDSVFQYFMQNDNTFFDESLTEH